MALRDIDDRGGVRELKTLDHWDDFKRQWDRYTVDEQRTTIEAIDTKLDELVSTPEALE